MICFQASVSVVFLTLGFDRFLVERAVVNGNKLFTARTLYSPIVTVGSLATVNVGNNVHANKLNTVFGTKGVGVSHAALLYSTCQV